MDNRFRQMGLPPFTLIIKNLIIINVLVWMAQSFISDNVSIFFENNFALHSFYSVYFKPWQLVTYMFLHSPFGGPLGISHILLNMFGLWMFGTPLEINFGPKRFLIFYLISGIGAGLLYVLYLQVALHPMANAFKILSANGGDINDLRLYAESLNASVIGASGAVFGVLAAFGYLFPNTQLYLLFLLPIKTKWAILGILVWELYGAFQGGDDIAHVAHLGGALVGFSLVFIWNRTNKTRFY